jgi:hypothetical protein
VPEPIRERIGELYRKGRTLDQIMDVLESLLETGELPEPVSRSSLGRYVKSEVVYNRLRASQEFAAKVLPTYGEAAKGDVGKLASLAVAQVALETVEQIGEHLAGAGASNEKSRGNVSKHLLLLSAALKNAKAVELGSQKQSLNTRREEREVKAEAAEDARKAASDMGLTDAQAQMIVDKILLGGA